MQNAPIPEEVVRLYRSLADCIRAKDREGAKRVYRELLHAKRPLSEVLTEKMRITHLTHNAVENLLSEGADNHHLATQQAGAKVAAQIAGVQAIVPTIDSEKRGDGQLTAEQVFSDCDAVGMGRGALGAALFLSSGPSLWLAGGVILAIISGTALPLLLPASEKLATTAIPPIQSAPAPDETLSFTGADSTIFPTGVEIVSAISPPGTPISTAIDHTALLEPPPGSAATAADVASAASPNTTLPVTTPGSTTPADEARPSAAEISALLARGDSLFAMSDIISARLFYERAAQSGDGLAALRLGETYDPDFHAQARMRVRYADLATAVFWYRRAHELGSNEAEILLKSVETKLKR
jgi:hypothetical protein